MKRPRTGNFITVIFFLVLIGFVVCTYTSVKAETPLPGSKFTAEKKTLRRWYDPVELRCRSLYVLSGKPLDNLRVYALRRDRLWPIPFEFDERTEKLRFVMPLGEKGNPEDGNGLLDPQDLLLVMARSSGDKLVSDAQLPGIDRFVEITLIDPVTREKGWVYVCYYADNPPQDISPPRMFLKYVDDAFLAGSEFYEIQGFVNTYLGDRYSTVMPQRFLMPVEAGGNGQNMLDRVKFRVQARALFGAVKMNANETDFIGRVDRYKVGPLRVFGRNWAAAKLPLGIRSPKLWADVYCYESYIIIPIKVSVPFNPDVIFTDSYLRVGFDLNESAFGMKYYNSNNLKGLDIDGRASDAEMNMNTDIDDWRLVTGPPGTIITRTVWDEGYREQTEITSHLIDDMNIEVPPESIPGQIGYHYIESLMESVSAGTYEITFIFYFPPKFYDPDKLNIKAIQNLLNIRDMPLQVKVGNTTEDNTACRPYYLSPEFE